MATKKTSQRTPEQRSRASDSRVDEVKAIVNGLKQSMQRMEGEIDSVSQDIKATLAEATETNGRVGRLEKFQTEVITDYYGYQDTRTGKWVDGTKGITETLAERDSDLKKLLNLVRVGLPVLGVLVALFNTVWS